MLVDRSRAKSTHHACHSDEGHARHAVMGKSTCHRTPQIHAMSTMPVMPVTEGQNPRTSKAPFTPVMLVIEGH